MHDGTYLIGRKSSDQRARRRRLLAIDDAGVSEEHAELTVMLGSYYLRDLGSRNGTWRASRNRVERISEDYVDPGETILFGRSARCIADLIEAATGERPDSPKPAGADDSGGDPIPPFRAAWGRLRPDGDPIPSFRAAWQTVKRPSERQRHAPRGRVALKKP